jgi:hypothetical protein
VAKVARSYTGQYLKPLLKRGTKTSQAPTPAATPKARRARAAE